jgi:hypothetical protein
VAELEDHRDLDGFRIPIAGPARIRIWTRSSLIYWRVEMSWMRSTFLMLFLAVAPAAALAVPTLAPDQLQPGQKAVVKTVFEGQRIEEFEAEIVGVLRGGRVAGDMILARATSERVVKTGIAQGMSGSPVYVDGKLVGALSSGWSFTREPLFGITPIGEMLQVLEIPSAKGGESAGSAGPTGLEPVGKSALRYREFRWPQASESETLEAPAPASTAAQATPAPLSIPVACAGLDPGALPWARTVLEPLGFTAVPGGRASAASPLSSNLEPGSAVAVELLRGDLQLAAIGTVTWKDGDRVLIFGHPFFQSGHVKMPLAAASITTIVASDLISFKLGVAGQPVGVATQDRRAAVAGHLGDSPRLMPLSVTVRGAAGRQTFRFESIEDRALAPQLVAIATINSLLESGGLGSGQTVRWRLALHRHGHTRLELHDVVAGGALAGDLLGSLASPLQFLYNNPYGKLSLDSLSVELEVEPGLDLWTLRGVQMLDAAVRPGHTLRVRCDVERWRGDRRSVDLSLRVPEEIPAGRYTLWVGGGSELTRYEAVRLPGRYRPTSLEDAWRRIGEVRTGDHLYAALLARAPEVTRRGHDYPELPVSALALMASGQQAEDATRRGMQAILDESRRPFEGQLRGEVQLEVTVDPKAP